jgi:hypothetical protein
MMFFDRDRNRITSLRRFVRTNPSPASVFLGLTVVAVSLGAIYYFTREKEAKAEEPATTPPGPVKQACPSLSTVELEDAKVPILLAWQERWASRKDEPNAGGAAMTDLFSSLFPECDWSPTTPRRLELPGGVIDWPVLYNCAATHTLAETTEDDGPCAALAVRPEGAPPKGLFG